MDTEDEKRKGKKTKYNIGIRNKYPWAQTNYILTTQQWRNVMVQQNGATKMKSQCCVKEDEPNVKWKWMQKEWSNKTKVRIRSKKLYCVVNGVQKQKKVKFPRKWKSLNDLMLSLDICKDDGKMALVLCWLDL